MQRTLILMFAALAISFGPAALAEQTSGSSKPIAQTMTPGPQAAADAEPAADSDVRPGDYPGERATTRTLSTVLAKGIDGQGLTMEEKWSNNVIVCKRMNVTGTRFVRKVCHTRGEWQAMRSNSREVMDYVKIAGAP